jgi:hypothetical protein
MLEENGRAENRQQKAYDLRDSKLKRQKKEVKRGEHLI